MMQKSHTLHILSMRNNIGNDPSKAGVSLASFSQVTLEFMRLICLTMCSVPVFSKIGIFDQLLQNIQDRSPANWLKMIHFAIAQTMLQ